MFFKRRFASPYCSFFPFRNLVQKFFIRFEIIIQKTLPPIQDLHHSPQQTKRQCATNELHQVLVDSLQWLVSQFKLSKVRSPQKKYLMSILDICNFHIHTKKCRATDNQSKGKKIKHRSSRVNIGDLVSLIKSI